MDFRLGVFMIGIRVGDGNHLHFGHLDGDVGLGVVVGLELVFHVAGVVIGGVADVEDQGDYYDDCILWGVRYYCINIWGMEWGGDYVPRPCSYSGNGSCGHCPCPSSFALQS